MKMTFTNGLFWSSLLIVLSAFGVVVADVTEISALSENIADFLQMGLLVIVGVLNAIGINNRGDGSDE